MLKILTVVLVIVSGLVRADADAGQICDDGGCDVLVGQGERTYDPAARAAAREARQQAQQQAAPTTDGRSKYFDQEFAKRRGGEVTVDDLKHRIAEQYDGEVDAVSRYRDYLPEQLLSLSEDELRNSVPMMYGSAAKLATSPAG